MRLIPVILLFSLPIFAVAETADKKTECVIKEDSSAEALVITSDQTILNKNDIAKFNGKVVICYDDSELIAEKAQISKSEQLVEAEGEIHYRSPLIDIKSTNFEADLDNSNVEFINTEFQMQDFPGRGQAQSLGINKNKEMSLRESSFSSCPVGDNSWELTASSIEIDTKEGWGEARNSVLKIKDTPILYLPYFSFPINDQRRSGFLYPDIKSSVKYGLEIKTPYYINLAPNYDVTLTPRYFAKRGFQLQTEFRYLTERHQGLIDIEGMKDDDDAPELGSRYRYSWQNKSQLSERWRSFVDYTDVSDDAYLTDLRPVHNNENDTQLYKHINFSYFGDVIDSKIRFYDFEILGDHVEAYQTLPQIELSSAKPLHLFSHLDFHWLTEFSHFENSTATIDRAERLHFEPSLQFQHSTPAWSSQIQFALLQTYYDQHKHELATETVENSISRTIPRFVASSQLHFEREARWENQQALQTFEPQIQYLFIPFRDQSNIGNFDSTLLQDDYYGLFRLNRFSGLDRIADANQLTLGATTRLFDNKNHELMYFSFGQVFYFSRQENNQNPRLNPTVSVDESHSALAGELMVNWHRRWKFYGELQYDSSDDRIEQSNFTLAYRQDDITHAQLNHRYSRNVSGNNIEQVGLNTSFPLDENWQFVGGYYRDLIEARSVESFVGLQYDSCCFAVRFTVNRKIDTNLQQLQQLNNDNVRFDSGFAIQFIFKGLGGDSQLTSNELLKESLFGRQRRYFTNN